MYFFYNLSIYFLNFGLYIASIWSRKARAMVRGRNHWRRKIESTLINKNNTRVWFHCASLGEFEMARPVIEKLQIEFPDWEIIITFFSPSGYELRNHFLCTGVFYLPLDTYKNAKHWYQIIQPDIAVFVKYEFWLNYMRVGIENGIKLIAISTLFREGQFIFEPWAAAWKNNLIKFKRIFVQNETSALIGKEENLPNIVIAGDNRFDRVLDTVENLEPLELISNFKGDANLLIGGSTWPDEEKHLHEYLTIKSWPLGWKYAIAPHDISEMHIRDIYDRFSEFGIIKYSEMQAGKSAEKCKVIVIDNIGLLARIYRYGNAAVIGGAWGKGLHNILEAAAFGMPILFGPKHDKFPEAQEGIDAGFCYSAKDYNEFEFYLNRMLGNVELRQEMAQKASDYVKNKAGATEIVMDYFRKL